MTMTLPTPGEVDPANPDSDFYWSGLREHVLLVQRCESCGAHRFPPMPGCPACGSDQTQIVTCSGAGSVYSAVVVHRGVAAELPDELPCSILTVELAEGARIFARLSGATRAEIGERVQACFVDHATWTELRFRPHHAS